MTTLDARAHSAAASLNRSVAEFTPTVSARAIVYRTLWHQALNYAGVAAVVVLAIVVGAWLRIATDDGPVADTIPPVVSTTVPELDAPPVEIDLPDIIVPEVSGDPDIPPPPPPVVDVGGEEPSEEPEEPIETDTEPPLLEITTPEDGATFEQKAVEFAGMTEPEAVVTAGPYNADVDAEGHWSIVLILSEGGNGATFTATDQAGNSTSLRITVYYQPPAPPEEPPGVEFKAYATFGSCALDPPYDIYYGTATPGAKITVSSEHGGGVVYADGEGDWEIQVFFPEAPLDETFLVKVKDDEGHSKSFEFVALAE